MATAQTSAEAPAAGQDSGYMAFISYSHSDNRDEGRKWADWLHQALETYAIPADLIGRPNQAGEPVPRQIYPVFQDEKELSASADLSTALQAALARSQHVVFLSSPRSAASPYVVQELTFFKQLGRGHRITALILAGEPEHGEKSSPLQCFPEVLRYHVDAAGRIDKNQLEEPLAADVRLPGGPDQGFTTPEAYRRFLLGSGNTDKKEIESLVQQYKGRLELAKLKLIAGILQVPLGELTKRDQAYQLERMRRKNRIIKGVAAVIAVLALAATIAGLVAWNQRNQAQEMLARSLFLSGQGQMNRGQVADAAAYMAAAVRLGSKSAAMFGQSLLLQTDTETSLPQLNSEVLFSNDARFLAGISATSNASEQIELWDVAHKKRLRTITVPDLGKTPTIRFDDLHRLWVLTSGGDIYRLKPEGEPELVRKNTTDAAYSNLEVKGDGTWLVLQRQGSGSGMGDTRLVLIPVATKEQTEFTLPMLSMERLAHDGILFSTGVVVQYSKDRLAKSTRLAVYPLEGGKLGEARRSYVDLSLPRLTLSAAGGHLLFWDNSAAFLLDLNGEAAPRQLTTSGVIEQAAFNPDGKSLVLINKEGIALYDVETANLITHKSLVIDPLVMESAFVGDNTAADGIHSVRLVQGQPVLRSSGVPSFVEAQLNLGPEAAQVRSGRDSHYLFVKRRQGHEIERWHVQSATQEAVFVRAHGPIERWDILRQANLLYTVSPGKEVRFYKVENGTMVGRPVQLKSTYFSTDQPEERFIARQTEDRLAIWEIASGNQLATIPLADAKVKFMPSPDFKQILFLHPDGKWHVDSMESGMVLHQGEGNLLSARFTGDSRLLLAFGSDSAEIFATQDYQRLFTIPSTGANPIGDISADGSMIALADSTNQVRLWDVHQQQAVGQPIPLDPISKFFRFSADGKRIITTQQSTIRAETGVMFYDAFTGLPLTVPLALSNRLDILQLPLDESRLFTMSMVAESSLATVWTMPDDDMPAPAELATDLEQVYGKAYAPQTGAIITVPAANERANWYLQSPYSRSLSPQSARSVVDYLRAYAPIKDESGLRILASLWRNHPLARAAMAEYYSRTPATAFLADKLMHRTRLQIAGLPQSACPAQCQELLDQCEANLQRIKEP